VFENGILRRIFEPKRDEVVGGWKKLHNEVLHNMYSSPTLIRTNTSIKMRRAECVNHWGKRDAYRILVGSQGKRYP
jgi:hypothetical protein